MKSKNKNQIIRNLEISDLAAEGVAVGRHENIVVFVKGVIPGDVIDVVVTKKRKNYFEAKPICIVEKSTDRIDPFCEHFGICGGCKWQMLPYSKQLYYKEKQVKDQFQRIGKLYDFKIYPILASNDEKFYRNKLEFTFSHRRWLYCSEPMYDSNVNEIKGLGFHVQGMFDKVVDIKKCFLQKDPSNEIRNKIREFTIKNSYEYYNPRDHVGLMRNLIVRNTSLGHLMVIVVFANEDREKISTLMNFIAEEFPEITSLQYVINPKFNDSLYDLKFFTIKGEDFIIEELNGLKFKIGPKSFFQTNIEQTKRLYDTVLKFANPKTEDIIYDLYTGTGTIALCMAKHCKKVVGIESVSEAIDNAYENAKLNDINNIAFYAGDIKDIFTFEFVNNNNKPDIIVMDPPRTGVHANVLQKINEIEPNKIVYVSCNPATQARDIELLSEKYFVEQIQPVDMFPYTHHVENVALLVLRN